ncbi:hypothetical protein EPH95_12215 [Salicibibacter halophilus]|uniref:LppX_LprAFG lipoprotein n=1 Tax=Salicibibacter halophilus TaxID=2502791 RepID=A0A514LJ38_9BACI|nr:DUF6612 family protein [Salicibibacter halophilus]QDI91847.1 hypothetical protein EPH95_12215 [Salicibibacter halophilus]
MKYKFGFFILLIIPILNACNDDENSEEMNIQNDNNDEQHHEITEEDNNLTAILEQSIETMSNLDSFAVTMTSKQEIAFDDETSRTESITETSVTYDPFAYHEETTIVTEDRDEEMNIESYFTDDGFYSYESSLDEWAKFPEELEGDIRELSAQQQDPERLLEILMAQMDDGTMAAEDGQGHYAITVEGDTEGLQEVSATLTDTMDGGMDMVLEDILSVADINDITYEILIDRESYAFQEFNTQIDMDFEAEEGQNVASRQTITTSYGSFNEIDEINVPDHVESAAEEIDFQLDLAEENS